VSGPAIDPGRVPDRRRVTTLAGPVDPGALLAGALDALDRRDDRDPDRDRQDGTAAERAPHLFRIAHWERQPQVDGACPQQTTPGQPAWRGFPLVSFVQGRLRRRMTISHRQRTGCAALALCALAGCSRIGDAPGEPADARPPPADAAAPGADAALTDAGAGPLESLVIPTDGTAVATTAITTAGTTYRLAASGTFKWGGCDATSCPNGAACNYDRLGDAYHRSDDCWATTTPNFSYISLYVDGQQVNWGAYAADHVYSVDVAGTGAALSFAVMDCDNCYLDNSGQLAVEVYPAD
jgi:hypothetical protein